MQSTGPTQKEIKGTTVTDGWTEEWKGDTQQEDYPNENGEEQVEWKTECGEAESETEENSET